MKRKKILILLPDGVGLRNFAFTSFVRKGKESGWDIVFWNNTPFDLASLNYKSIALSGKPRAYTDLLKRAKINAELDHFTSKFGDKVYQDYKFKASYKGLKNLIKNLLVSLISKSYSGEKGLGILREKLQHSERKGDYYSACKNLLEKEKPDFIFCTNQRPLNAIAPLTAASDLGIPTASFIYSWDNLPKATLIVEADNYFVWSNHMKKELLEYYPYINSAQVSVTGTPQFEPHFENDYIQSRESFFKENKLDLNKEYICFSGDDITTSPDDPQYLSDVAESVENLNKDGHKLGIIFRRCPVDFSNRYDDILNKYKGLIVSLDPKWMRIGEDWNKILPTIEDQYFLYNTIYHSKAAVNLGSSMVFDFAIHGKPCLYLNYDVEEKIKAGWSTSKIYNFVHFRTMPSKDVVFWINSKEELGMQIQKALNNPLKVITEAKQWFDLVNQHPAKNNSQNIWNEIKRLHDS